MGNNQINSGPPPLTGPKSKLDIKRDITEQTIEDIMKLSKKLWKNYHLNFLDKDFCKNLAISQENTLKQFSMTQLKDIHNKINDTTTQQEKKFKAFLEYNPREQERFLVNQLKIKLVNHFHDKDIPFPTEGDTAYKGTTLQYENYDRINRQLHQKGGQDDELAFIEAEIERRREALKRFNKKDNVNEEIIFNIKEINKNNKEIEKKLNSLPVELVSDRIIATNSKDGDKNKRKEVAPNKKSLEENKKSNTKNKTEVKNARRKNVPENKEVDNRGPVHFGDKFSRMMSEVFPDCEDTDKDCRLTKKELCKKIVQHFMIRLSLIAAIVTVLPKKGKRGYYGGFCYKRYLGLRDGKLCLPPNYDYFNSMAPKLQFKELSKYINQFSSRDCNRVNGLWRELNEKELAALRVNQGEFNRYYLDYTAKLQRQYQNSIIALLDLLKQLEKTPIIGNALLNELTAKAKDIIDSMYQSCHRNYLYGVLAMIRADIETTPKKLANRKGDLDVLKEGLN